MDDRGATGGEADLRMRLGRRAVSGIKTGKDVVVIVEQVDPLPAAAEQTVVPVADHAQALRVAMDAHARIADAINDGLEIWNAGRAVIDQFNLHVLIGRELL